MSNLESDVNRPRKEEAESDDLEVSVAHSEISSVGGSTRNTKSSRRVSSSSERQFQFERAQKCLENAALVSKRIKEHRKATAELLGRPFEDNDCPDTSLDSSSVVSGYTEKSDYEPQTHFSVAEALNIPGISESLANTLREKELLMERIKQYKVIQQERNSKKSGHRRSISNVDASSPETKKGSMSEPHQAPIREEAQVTVLQVKIRAMETTIMELQEKLSEKESLLEAKIKASTLLSDNMSKKERDALTILEDTRSQMIKLQENFASMEESWNEERNKLNTELEAKNYKIAHLEEANSILEKDRFELSISEVKLKEELLAKESQIKELETNLNELIQTKNKDFSQQPAEKGSVEIEKMNEMSKKIELLEQINLNIRQTNMELEQQLQSSSSEVKSASSSGQKKQLPSPQLGRKRGKSSSRQQPTKNKSPWSQFHESGTDESKTVSPADNSEVERLKTLLESMNKQLLDKELLLNEQEMLLSKLRDDISQYESDLSALQKELSKKSTEAVDHQPFVPPTSTGSMIEHTASMTDLEKQLLLAQEQISSFSSELENANKSMLKVKSEHKAKVKQMQKTIDAFSKVSDSNAEVIRLLAEVNKLQQKIVELEEDKGNLQLHLVDYDSGRLSESDIQKKICSLENTAETRLKAISDLEMQKFDLVQELHLLKQKNDELEEKLADLCQVENEQISNELKTVQLEEQIDELTSLNNELMAKLKKQEDLNFSLESSISILNKSKGEISLKLEQYVQENAYLTDKVEKMSTEKVSSAESIEIVESLTSQERIEMEEQDKALDLQCLQEKRKLAKETEIQDELQKVQNERDDLMKKIDLFSNERHEVMSKMDSLKNENEKLKEIIENLNLKISDLEKTEQLICLEKDKVLTLNEELNQQLESVKKEYTYLVEEQAKLLKHIPAESTETAKDIGDTTAIDDKQSDEKLLEEKSNNKAKTMKQLTKDILKLKNIVKDREAEIADCQMKILSLEEQIQKDQELLQKSLATNLALEKAQMQIESGEIMALNEKITGLSSLNNMLNEQIKSIQIEYQQATNAKERKIQELEEIILKGQASYDEAVNKKEKDIAEYLNQIHQLNVIAQKLKSTIEVLEEEKSKDDNGELINQIILLQNSVKDHETKVAQYEEERNQVIHIKTELESKVISLENECRETNKRIFEYENTIADLHSAKKCEEEKLFVLKEKCKEKDEEIHEIKLQLRKESIEYDTLRKNLANVEQEKLMLEKQLEEMSGQIESSQRMLQDNPSKEMEAKYKELLEKLKKYAVNLKKKAHMCTELESTVNILKQNLEKQEKIIDEDRISKKELLDEIYNLKKQINEANETNMKKMDLQNQVFELSKLNSKAKDEINHLNTILDETNNKIEMYSEEIKMLSAEVEKCNRETFELKKQNEELIAKVRSYENEIKTIEDAAVRVSCLENDLQTKENAYVGLMLTLDSIKEEFTNAKHSHEAKLQERDLYIESLETSISNYKQRTERLEESISIMEERRHSLERKADSLGDQLHEKQNAYREYSYDEDELINRLAMLMEHDKVVEKQLKVIENENFDLMNKMQNTLDENESLKKELTLQQLKCQDMNSKCDNLQELENNLYNALQRGDVAENQLKNYEKILKEKQSEIHSIEMEFHNQIDEALKEKKSIVEKYEKLSEHVTVVEQQLGDSMLKIDLLSKDCEYLKQEKIEYEQFKNQRESLKPENVDIGPYIDEINRLQAELAKTLLQNSDLQSRVENLKNELDKQTILIKSLQSDKEKVPTYSEKAAVIDIDNTQADMFSSNEVQEQHALSQYFQSNNNEAFDMLNLQSQIVNIDKISEEQIPMPQVSESLQQAYSESGEVLEIPIVPKVAYECFPRSEDPFNSDDGWGFGGDDIKHESEFSSLSSEMLSLKEENNKLKEELKSVNIKLHKAVKKLKELKMTNENLSQQIKLNRQMGGLDILDSAIEDELKKQNKSLEEKINELNSSLNKEKKEKDSLYKQNDILHQGNEKLIEAKEKLDSEVQIWKFKFKELNDKFSNASTNEPNVIHSYFGEKPASDKEAEMSEMERENNEYGLLVEQLNQQINSLVKEKQDLTVVVETLKDELEKLKQAKASSKDIDECILSQISILEETNKEQQETLSKLKLENNDLVSRNERLEERHNNVVQDLSKADVLKSQFGILDSQCKFLNFENEKLLRRVDELENSTGRLLQNQRIEINATWQKQMSELESIFAKKEQKYKTQMAHIEKSYEHMLDNYQPPNPDNTAERMLADEVMVLERALKTKEEHFLNIQKHLDAKLDENNALRAELNNEKRISGSQNADSQLAKLDEQERIIESLINEKNTAVDTITKQLQDAEIKIENLKSEKQNIIEKCNDLDQIVTELKLQIKLKEAEMTQKNSEISTILALKKEEFEELRTELLNYQQKLEDLTFKKESELAVLRLQVHEGKVKLQSDYDKLEGEKLELSKQLEECIVHKRTIVELNKSLEEKARENQDMRNAMESQEIDIVTLKDELEKVLMTRPKHVTFSPGTSFHETNEDNTSFEQVPRAELDLALYMLHQRDVRCEELTLELTQLLEERDTLQLRLSDSLRVQEDLRQNCLKVGIAVPEEDDTNINLPASLEPSDHIAALGSTRGSDRDLGLLQSKLSELRGVRQNRDVLLREESEQRHRQMDLLHRDLANLPPEAAEQLRQAHHTISHDTQSTSSVLLNWLRGKTTPKVVHM